jgi:hypothetical protein
MKKLLLLFSFIFLFAYDNTNYTILKKTNEIVYDTTLKIVNNKKWMDKFFSLSTYTYHDYNKIFKIYKILLSSEQERLNKYVPIFNNKIDEEYIKTLQKYKSKILYYLSKSPDKLENVYYMLYYYEKLMRIHNFLLQIYKDDNSYIYKQIYLTPFYKDDKKSLYFYFNYIEREYIKTFNKFIDDLKENTFWFLRYFGKSVKFEKKAKKLN